MKIFAAEPDCPEPFYTCKKASPNSLFEADKLKQVLSLAELPATVEGFTMVPALDRLPKFYKTFWPLFGPDLLRIFQDHLKDGIFPVSCNEQSSCCCPRKEILVTLKLATSITPVHQLQNPDQSPGHLTQNGHGLCCRAIADPNRAIADLAVPSGQLVSAM